MPEMRLSRTSPPITIGTSSTVSTTARSPPTLSGSRRTRASAMNGCARRMRTDSSRASVVHASPSSKRRKSRTTYGSVVRCWSTTRKNACRHHGVSRPMIRGGSRSMSTLEMRAPSQAASRMTSVGAVSGGAAGSESRGVATESRTESGGVGTCAAAGLTNMPSAPSAASAAAAVTGTAALRGSTAGHPSPRRGWTHRSESTRHHRH
jgi:hypothetical protein